MSAFCCCCSWVASVVSDSMRPHGLQPARLFCPWDSFFFFVHGILKARVLEWVAFPSPGDLPHSGIEPRSPALQADSLPLSHQGSPIECLLCAKSCCRQIEEQSPKSESKRLFFPGADILIDGNNQDQVNIMMPMNRIYSHTGFNFILST